MAKLRPLPRPGIGHLAKTEPLHDGAYLGYNPAFSPSGSGGLMRSLGAAFIVGLVVLGAGTVDRAVADECRISDSALCLANPNCHWDVDKRGCEPGPLQASDACAAHSDKSVCEADTTLGCQWLADKKECVSKAK
jgi:hypothetical protein